MASRRTFLTGLGVAAAAPAFQSPRTIVPEPPNPLRTPESAHAVSEDGARVALARSGSAWQGKGIEVSTENGSVFVTAPNVALRSIRLRWHGVFPARTRFLGDHWERSYGDLEFRGFNQERLMPWYFLAGDEHSLSGYGVKTGASAICAWQADAGGVTLWLDVSNGGRGVELGDRKLRAATIVCRKGPNGESGLQSATAFCRLMCPHPLLTTQPIYGSNNWYYAYGNNTTAERTLRDAELMAELAPSQSSNRPFVVIDMGWHAARDGAGPQTRTNAGYPDMPGLAKKMRASGVRPGLWTRPTLTSDASAAGWRLPPAGGRSKDDLISLDASIPEAVEYMATGVRTLHDWGYELIKHDFSTFDLTGRWGFQMGPDLTERGWSFHDRSRTTAEIITGLYRAIRAAAGSSVLIGCNTIGHLAAGLVEVQRIGDDTSGREWERTRKMGVNTLAFRMPQHNTFFSADADCVPLTEEVPWELNRQWLDLVARSGTALFVSVDPAILKADQKPALKAALEAASRPHPPAVARDWMETTTPQHWLLDGKPARFDWYL